MAVWCAGATYCSPSIRAPIRRRSIRRRRGWQPRRHAPPIRHLIWPVANACWPITPLQSAITRKSATPRARRRPTFKPQKPCWNRPSWTLSTPRSEEHTSELQSLMRNSYAVFCLKKKKNTLAYEDDTYREITQDIHSQYTSQNEI